MSRIAETFGRLRAKGEKALVGFITAGDPDPGASLDIARRMCLGGLDVLELGVPFSDPTADGPVIQRSSARALGAGVNMKTVMEMVRGLREVTSIPLVLFSYYNPILAFGAGEFYREAAAAGADGALVVDLPHEESDELTALWGDELDFIRLVAPTTPPGRMAEIASKASGFIYLVSMTGITGSAGLNHKEVALVARDLKENCGGMPICIGFGISTPEQAAEVCEYGDGVVVGSAFERLIESNLGTGDIGAKMAEFVAGMKSALSKRGAGGVMSRH